MRQYVWDTPWFLSLLCASTSTIYFKAFGMMSAINFWFASMMCLYSSLFIYVNRSASCFSALPFNNGLEMHLQNGFVFCIWSMALCLSSVRCIGVTSWVLFTVVRWQFSCWVEHWRVQCLWLFGIGVMFCFLCWMLVHCKRWLWAFWLWICYCLVVWLIWRGNRQPCSVLLRSIWMWCCRVKVLVPICCPCCWHSIQELG